MITQVRHPQTVLDAARRRKREIRVGYVSLSKFGRPFENLITLQTKKGECEIVSYQFVYDGHANDGAAQAQRLVDALRRKGYTVIVGITGILELTQAGIVPGSFSTFDDFIAYIEEKA